MINQLSRRTCPDFDCAQLALIAIDQAHSNDQYATIPFGPIYYATNACLGSERSHEPLSWLIIVQGTGWILANLKHILSAARTPPAPSIIQFRGGQHWLQLGMHNPQCTARAVLKAAHFHPRVAHIQGPSSYAWRPRIRTSVQGQPTAEAQGHRYSQRPSRTAPVHTAGAPPRHWGRCPGIKTGSKRQRAPGVPAAARGSAHPRAIETNQH